MRALSIYHTCILLFWPVISNASEQAETERLFLGRLSQGVVKFESLQGNHLDALLRLNTGLSQYENRHDQQLENAQPLSNSLTIADLQLALGLSQFAENQLTENRFSENDGASQSGKNHHLLSQNNTAYELAWFYYYNNQPVKTIQILQTIQGDSYKASTDDIQYLRALAYLGVGKFKAAAEILKHLPADNHKSPYTQYNLAVAWLQTGDDELARSTLASLGMIVTSDVDTLALKDLANLKLAYRYLQANKPEQAKASFGRVRLDGPFTNQALLGSGWASFSMGKVERAIVPWTLLYENEAVNDSVIEAKMALPYAYSKLGAHGKAANLYAHTIQLFEAELSRLDVSMNAIRSDELRQAIVDQFDSQGDDWFIDLSRRSGQQQHFHLPLLLSNEEFRRLADSLQQLGQVKNRIEQAQISVAAYSELGKLKQNHYASNIPEAEKELFDIYKKMKSIMPNESQPSNAQDNTNKVMAEVTQLRSSYTNYLQVRKATVEYNQQLPVLTSQLSELSNKLQRLNKKLNSAITSTAQQMTTEALEILDQKRKQLQSYHSDALFALAESYDLATGKRQ